MDLIVLGEIIGWALISGAAVGVFVGTCAVVVVVCLWLVGVKGE